MSTAAPDPEVDVTSEKPSLTKMKTILAQIYLMSALEELTDLRKTLRLQGRALDELRQKPSLPSDVVTELLATVQRRDHKFASRLAALRTSVRKANNLLLQTDENLEMSKLPCPSHP